LPRFHRRRPSTSEGIWALRLVIGGFWLTVLVALFIALTGIHGDVGPVTLLGIVAFIGLLSTIAGGIFAIVAITRRGEGSILVLATLPVWVVAVVLVVGELAQLPN
jgi:hypothetical protein